MSAEEQLAQLAGEGDSEQDAPIEQDEQGPTKKRRGRPKGTPQQSSIYKGDKETFGVEVAGPERSSNASYSRKELKDILERILKRCILSAGASPELLRSMAEQMDRQGVKPDANWNDVLQVGKLGALVARRMGTLENPKARKPRKTGEMERLRNQNELLQAALKALQEAKTKEED